MQIAEKIDTLEGKKKMELNINKIYVLEKYFTDECFFCDCSCRTNLRSKDYTPVCESCFEEAFEKSLPKVSVEEFLKQRKIETEREEERALWLEFCSPEEYEFSESDD